MSEKPVVTIGDMPIPEVANTVRVAVSEDLFMIDFGYMSETETEKTVKVVSSIHIPAKILYRVVHRLFSTGVLYEKKFQTNIGFTPQEKEVESRANQE